MQNNIIIPNQALFDVKVRNIREDGVELFQVVVDFDRTLTPAFVDGQATTTSFAKVRKGKVLPEEYEIRADELFAYYHPIEESKLLSEEEINSHMKEWWKLHLQLMVDYGITQEIFDEIASSPLLQLRGKNKDFFELLLSNSIPLSILSAGVGDLVIALMKREGRLTKNVGIVSNLFDFDQNGKAIAIKGPVIHSSNKHEVEMENQPFYENVKNRKNVLLLGDNEGDLTMTAGLDTKIILKIGFLNEDVDERLQFFKDNFDVVLLGDPDLSFVNELLETLIK